MSASPIGRLAKMMLGGMIGPTTADAAVTAATNARSYITSSLAIT
jgi:hypothetical protein